MRELLFAFFVFAILVLSNSCKNENNSIFRKDSSTNINEEWKEFQPVLKNNKKFTIGLIQSDDYPEYYEVFTSIVDGLILLGWLDQCELLSKENYSSNREMLDYIQNKAYSSYIDFNNEMFFSFMASSDNADSADFKKIMNYAMNNKIDLVILLGTLASKEVLNYPGYHTNTVMDAVSDPLGSKLINSIDDSGKDNLTGRIDTKQYYRQIKLFFDVIKFSKLGLIYENSENGRNYSAVEYVEQLSKELNFKIIKSNNAMAEPTISQYPQAWQMYLDAMDDVCPKVDALFLGVSGGLEPGNMSNVVKKLIQYKTPSFAMEGAQAVKQGIMLGVSGKDAGLYNAKKIAGILKGTIPRQLNQNFEKQPKISINLKTADLINYNLPVDIIRSADIIYTSISENRND